MIIFIAFLFFFISSNDFIITTSNDGHLKFWKKTATGIEFVKHYRSHVSGITGISLSADHELLATISDDMALKIYDVTNFGNYIKLFYFVFITLKRYT